MTNRDIDWRTQGTPLPCGHRVLDVTRPHYCTYVHLDLLEESAMAPRDSDGVERPWHNQDESLFQTVHRCAEVAFQDVILTLQMAREHMFNDNATEAWKLLGEWDHPGCPRPEYIRPHVVPSRALQGLHTAQQAMQMLLSMDAANFLSFRKELKPASGAESIAFRVIEVLCGIMTNPEAIYAVDRGVEYTFQERLTTPMGKGDTEPKVIWWTHHLDETLEKPTLDQAFAQMLDRRGVTLCRLFEMHDEDVYDDTLRKLARALHRVGAKVMSFRQVHKGLAQRFIPMASSVEFEGTGHTSGVPYLESTLTRAHCFPELHRFFEENPGLL